MKFPLMSLVFLVMLFFGEFYFIVDVTLFTNRCSVIAYGYEGQKCWDHSDCPKKYYCVLAQQGPKPSENLRHCTIMTQA